MHDEGVLCEVKELVLGELQLWKGHMEDGKRAQGVVEGLTIIIVSLVHRVGVTML